MACELQSSQLSVRIIHQGKKGKGLLNNHQLLKGNKADFTCWIFPSKDENVFTVLHVWNQWHLLTQTPVHRSLRRVNLHMKHDVIHSTDVGLDAFSYLGSISFLVKVALSSFGKTSSEKTLICLRVKIRCSPVFTGRGWCGLNSKQIIRVDEGAYLVEDSECSLLRSDWRCSLWPAGGTRRDMNQSRSERINSKHKL